MPSKPDFPCPGCGKLLWSGRSSAAPEKRLCRDCRAQRSRETTRWRPPARLCAQCGKSFVPSSSKKTIRCCSFSCAQKRRCAEGRGRRTYLTEAERAAAELARWQRQNRRRRALKRGSLSERYTTEEIATRDGYRCGLCGRKVKMDQKNPKPLSPTIDHIVPISCGGDDLRTNVQLAHFRCNTSKGPRGGGEQLALVG